MTEATTPRPAIVLLVTDDDWLEPRGGGQTKRCQIASALARVGDLDVLVLRGDEATATTTRSLPSGDAVRVRTLPAWRGDRRSGLRAEATSLARSVLPATRLRHPGVERALAEVRPEVTVVDSIYLFGLVPALPGRRIVVTHNCESRLVYASAIHYPRWKSKVGGSLLAACLHLWERAAFRSSSQVWCVSQRDIDDYERLRLRAPYRIVRNAVATATVHRDQASSQRIGFFGSLAWLPNELAALELLAVSDRLGARSVDHEVVFLGHRPEPGLADRIDRHPHARYLGWIDDLDAALDEIAVLAFPLVFGSGTKYKVLEALARGIAVVTTPEGVRGLPELRDGDHLLVRELGRPFDEALVELLRDPARRTRLGAAGRDAVLASYGPDAILEDVRRNLAELLDA